MQCKHYLLSFVEEGIMNLDYSGYVAGRLEIHHKKHGDEREIRFLTKKESWHKFRAKYDLEWVSKKELDKIIKIIEENYQDK